MKKLLFIFVAVFALTSPQSYAGRFNLNIFSQTVYLGDAKDLITQNVVRGEYTWKEWLGNTYAGVYYDNDTKSDATITYTDKQLSPLIGHQTPYLFGIPVRFYTEFRKVDRIGDFWDRRKDKTSDIRAGFLGYDFVDFKHQFLEWYGTFFYTSLYDHDFILQAWIKHGKRFGISKVEGVAFDILHELNADRNQFIKNNNGYYNYRPGLRFGIFKEGFQLSLLQSYSISLSKNDYERPNEWRTLLVYAHYF